MSLLIGANVAALGLLAVVELSASARAQQRRAVRFDPFMENDIGPSLLRQYTTLDGTRPRDYAEPVAEVKRARWWSQPLP